MSDQKGKTQSAAFIAAARAAECDEREAEWDTKPKAVAKAPVPAKERKAKPEKPKG